MATVEINETKHRTGNTNCCVVNCGNTYGKDGKIRLYSFPNRKWEVERKLKWIQAIRRVNMDGTPWQPTVQTRICSSHFIGGEKSNNQNNPAYYPTIFPDIYRKSTSTYLLKRHERYLQRSVSTAIESGPAVEEPLQSSNEDQMRMELSACSQQDAFTQTDPSSLHYVMTHMFSERMSCKDIGTLCISRGTEKCEVATMTHVHTAVSTRTVSCGSDIHVDDSLIKSGFIGIESVVSELQMRQLAGVSMNVFNLLFSTIDKSLRDSTELVPKLKVSLKNRLLLFLMRLKLGLSLTVIAGFFCVHQTTACRIFREILDVLIKETKVWLFWPSKAAIKACIPPTFSDYPNCRAIIDCTELRCETPPTAEECVFLYSTYKGCHTLKILIATTPNGYISFVSPAYGGKASDSYITQESGFLDLLEPGDLILADKGFPQISTDVLQQDCILVMPPFLKGSQFKECEVQETYKVPKVRIHVKRIIQRFKIYKIFDKISIDLLPYIDDVIRISCILTNLQAPIIRKK